MRMGDRDGNEGDGLNTVGQREERVGFVMVEEGT